MNDTSTYSWLPAIVPLGESRDWSAYLERIYAIFAVDFLKFQPSFQGRRCNCKRHPMVDGKAATFWHLISEGKVEADRLPDLRRCERVPWPRPMIEHSDAELKVWKTTRKSDRRIVIALDDFSYIVVLADRRDYVLLWTAYCVEREHNREKLRKECEKYQREKSWGRP